MLYPAVKVTWVDGVDSDWLLAVVDEFGPTAAEEHGAGATSIFFTSAQDRDRACAALRAAFPQATISADEIDDGDWARRSQANLKPVTVGGVTVAPPWAVTGLQAPGSGLQGPQAPGFGPQSVVPNPQSLVIVILPSMGFGTGHHITTRLCLQALQEIDLRGRTVLDVGTGSGVLAIAAALLGASRAAGIDHDPDAIQAARDNLTLNPGVKEVTFDSADLSNAVLDPMDVVTANLTGALLCREASTLTAAVKPGGTLIVSGVLASERDEVVAAFDDCILGWEREEDGWVGLTLRPTKLGIEN